MATELVNSATNDKLAEVDWTKNIEICELVAHDGRQARDVVKAIKKRLGSKNANTQLYAVMLLEMLMNNIGEQVHRQVIDTGILPILVKIVKKKTELPIRERVFLLLDATQTSLGGASGKFPQYYTAYYDLVSAGMQFPQRPHERPSSERPSNNQTAQGNKKITLNGELATSRHGMVAQPAPVEPQVVPEASIIQKASNALEVLKERLPLGIIGSTIPGERLNRPLIRPLPSEQPQEPSAHPAPVIIPPPPAKHIQREKFFQEKKVDGSDVDSHMRGLSLHSRNASSSHGGSIDFGVTIPVLAITTSTISITYDTSIPAYLHFTAGASGFAAFLYLPPSITNYQDLPIDSRPMIVDVRKGGASDDALSKCLLWLYKHPSQSFMYFCFGGKGAFSVPQRKEMANGLE
ncbi:PREDICTED: class E vacuolar protein-sorting machinery protein hse1-like, partial [Populus euphratica]|uniref:Class E vacuolar protein-sorting machinery protein hse1-like n=1 Tax=Populus euphratica TaxID=75702 RepID=A0AAJ6TF57_POPEU